MGHENKPINIVLNCGKCGHDKVTVPDDAGEETPIVCPACGAQLSTWGELRPVIIEKAKQEGAKAIKGGVKQGFKGMKNYRFD
jgi:DNA-directed RNA polymerase subunit RPC12/RpoP